MPVIVRTGAALRKLFAGKTEVQGEGRTVRELLENLGIADRLCDENGSLRRHFNIHVNEGEDIRLGAGLDTPLEDGDTVAILSAIAGGAGLSRKVWLTFPRDLVGEPLIWEIGRRFEIVTNIRQASVSREVGLVGLEISGEEAEVEQAVAYLEQKGVSVEPVTLDVVE